MLCQQVPDLGDPSGIPLGTFVTHPPHLHYLHAWEPEGSPTIVFVGRGAWSVEEVLGARRGELVFPRGFWPHTFVHVHLLAHFVRYTRLRVHGGSPLRGVPVIQTQQSIQKNFGSYGH